MVQIPQSRSGGFAAGVDHAAALLPAALAFNLVGGSAVLGHAPGHPPAVAAEKLPVGKASGLGNRLHPPGNLRLRQPEHFLIAGRGCRPDGVQRPHGGGGDDHHGALGFGVGLGAGHGDAVAAVVPALHVATVRDEASERQSSASDSTATRATSNFSRWAACSGVSKPRPAAKAGLDGGEGAGLALGSGQLPPPSFQRGAHTLVPPGRFMAGQLVDLGAGAGGEAHGRDAGAITGALRQTARLARLL